MAARFYIACLLLLPLLLVACGKDEPAPSPELLATPTIAPLTDTAFTRLSPPAREALVDLAKRHQTVSDEWENFRLDFDRWREGLLVCDASTIQSGLRGFVADFAEITRLARALPRVSSLREVSGDLTSAIEGEEKALRELRELWQPESQDLFENVALQRTTAAIVNEQVEGALLDRQEKASSLTRVLVSKFSNASSKINDLWDTFHQDYDTFRSLEGQLSTSEAITSLNGLVTQFSSLSIQIRNLPATSSTRPVADILVEAAEAEELALRKLRSFFSEFDSEPGPFPMPSRPSFEEFDTQLVRSNALRRKAGDTLADILSESSAQSEQALEEFSTSYRNLLLAWESFHQEYDAWRRDEGGCQRTQVIETLAQFTVRFGELAGKVRGLPRLSILQPLSEVLVEAAEREEQALRALRNNWRPFDPQVYNFYDQERNAAGQLRRRVAAGINQLLTQYEVSSEELVR